MLMALTFSGPNIAKAWGIISLLPHKSMRRPRSCWKLMVVAAGERVLETHNDSAELKKEGMQSIRKGDADDPKIESASFSTSCNSKYRDSHLKLTKTIAAHSHWTALTASPLVWRHHHQPCRWHGARHARRLLLATQLMEADGNAPYNREKYKT